MAISVRNRSIMHCKPLGIEYVMYGYGLFLFYLILRLKIYIQRLFFTIQSPSISSNVKILMISVISSLSLKLYLINSLVYHRNIFGSSLKVFGNRRQSLDIFRNFQKFLENVREHLSGLRNNFGKSSESGRKSSENHQHAVINMFI